MTLRARVQRATARHPALGDALLVLPAGAWLLAFFAVPLGIMATYAVRPRHILGGVHEGWSTAALARLLDPIYLEVLLRSLWLAALATLVALLLAYPMALVITRAGRWRGALLFLVVLPFWTSFLVRTYAMIFLLRDSGAINQLLLALGIVDAPVQLLYTPGAVLFGLVTGFLPFAVLPIHASLEKLDPALDEAAAALGATGWRRFVRVTWPLSLPGVIAGGLLVFVPALGAFLTPDLLGGAKVMLVGNLVQNQFTTARHWPFGSALSLVLLGVVLVAMLVRLRWQAPEDVR